MSPLVPALLVVAAWLLLTRPGVGAQRLRALGPAGAAPGRRPGRAVPRPGADTLVAAAAGVAALTVGLAAGAGVLTGAYAARLLAGRVAAARAARENAAAMPGLCRTLAAELRAGAPPPAALARAADDAPPGLAAHLRRLAAAAHLGAGPPLALPPPPGADRLRAVAALWTVAADAGAGLADGLDRLAGALAAEQRRHAEVAAQLAGPRASAAVLAALPAFGLLLAAALGAEPVRFLTTPPGVACLLAAGALDGAGVWWVHRITRRAAR